MTVEEFVQVLKIQTSDAAVGGVVEQMERPSGRSPGQTSLDLAQWYSGLSEKDRFMLRLTLRKSAESAVFGVCCILDGVRPIEDGHEKGRLELYYVKGDERTRLNDPHGDELHDLYNAVSS
jgi:hypothetical protein